MANIKALRAWHYNYALAGSPASLVTPPYDVIGDDEQQLYYKANPYNIIRLEYGRSYSHDDDGHNRYIRAAADYKQWREMGILQRDDQPAIYRYVQEFTQDGCIYRRSGFLATIKAGGYDKAAVLPHEETLPGHKEDRYRLMQACLANFSPIFGLYNDSQRAVDTALAAAAEVLQPLIDLSDAAGVKHIVWRIDEPGLIAQVEQAMAAHKVYIADGHHRFETASRFAAEARAEGKAGCDRLLIHLVNLHDTGLLVLPTHRLVKNLPDFCASALLRSVAEQGFSLLPLPNLAALRERMHNLPPNVAGLGMYVEGSFYLLSIGRGHPAIASAQPGYSTPYQQLDVSIAQALILRDLCGLGQEQLAAGYNLDYHRDDEAAVALVDQGGYQFALLLNSTTVEEMLAVADSGEKMPQKSTYFYPKVIAGLLINQLGG